MVKFNNHEGKPLNYNYWIIILIFMFNFFNYYVKIIIILILIEIQTIRAVIFVQGNIFTNGISSVIKFSLNHKFFEKCACFAMSDHDYEESRSTIKISILMALKHEYLK